MRIFRQSTTGIVLIALIACESAPTSQPRRFTLLPGGDGLVLEGRWSATGQYSGQVPRSNAAHVECSRATGVCTEFLAQFVTKADDAHFHDPMLSTLVTSFRVVEWTTGRVVARAETPAYEIELRMSLSDRSAERTARETSAGGASGANPAGARLWTLQ